MILSHSCLRFACQKVHERMLELCAPKQEIASKKFSEELLSTLVMTSLTDIPVFFLWLCWDVES